MLQNRVDPFGNIIKTAARGHWMGNRGVIHDHHQSLVRPFRLLAWITCVLVFKDRKRQVMAPDRYTELFFLDEAGSFAAGHRPCCECRRKDYNAFKSSWLKGNPEYNFTEKTSIREIDKILHKERMDRDGLKVSFEESVKKLPNGTFVQRNGQPWLVFNHSLFLWTPFGYEKGIVLPEVKKLSVLTPRSVVNAFRAGYAPQVAVQVKGF
jgi:hypothetical protein